MELVQSITIASVSTIVTLSGIIVTLIIASRHTNASVNKRFDAVSERIDTVIESQNQGFRKLIRAFVRSASALTL